jgi:alpha-mannosidase
VEFINTVDKLAIRAKEGVHFGYAFNVPEGEVRMDVGLASVRPNWDQIPASCKNWFSVQRWVDISNEKFGVTWSPVDAPLVQLGGLTANLIGSQTDYRVWITKLEPSQKLFSWVMNNHWHTNYRAEQQGPTIFRFALRAHRGYAAATAAKFGVSCSQPLIPAPAKGPRAKGPLLKLSNDAVVATALKRSDDGKAWIVRLFGASGSTEKVNLAWMGIDPQHVTVTGLGEQAGAPVNGAITVPGWGVVTLRAE